MKHLVVFILVVSLSTAYGQGIVDGFFKGKGRTDVALGFAYENSNNYYAATKFEYSRTLVIFSAFAEYGITDKWDVISSVPFINGKFQDASFFTKYELVKFKGFSVVPALGISFPLSKYNTETSQAIGQRATNIQPKLVLQYKPNTPWFVQAQGGYQYTLDPVPPAYNFSAKVGYGKNKFYTDIWFDYQKSTSDLVYLGKQPVNSFRELGVEYTRIGGVLYYQLKPKFGASLNFSQVLNGQNIGSATIIGAGAIWKFGV